MSVDDLAIPFAVRVDLRWADEFDLRSFPSLFLKRLQEILRAEGILRHRFNAARRLAETWIERIGSGASLERLIFEPRQLDEKPGAAKALRFLMAFNALGNNLKPKTIESTFGGLRGML